jgi:translation initiation factor IF-1
VSDAIEFEGVVTETLKGDIYRVEVVAGALRRIVLAKRSGRMNVKRIRVITGDRVRVECSPYDLQRGRIVRRIDVATGSPVGG